MLAIAAGLPSQYDGGDGSTCARPHFNPVSATENPPFSNRNEPVARLAQWYPHSLKGLIVAVQLAQPRARSDWCFPRPACA